MKKTALLLLLAFALSSGAWAGEFCQDNPAQWTADMWENCNGKKVRFTGKRSERIYQHPTGMHSFYDVAAKKFVENVENYVQVGNQEIVVTYAKPFDCASRIQIEGIVDIVDLGGEEGTKQSYRNVWVRASSYACVE